MKNIEKIGINGNFVTNEEVKKMGFKKDRFNYYVNASILKNDTKIVIEKCKAIESTSGRETIYFKEQDSGIMIFILSENPDVEITKKLKK
jgi:hypothetical protein